MPQMAPISWLCLFFLFSIIFLTFNILNYFCFYKKMNKNNNLMKFNLKIKNDLNWKW